MSLNEPQITVAGNLTADPELRFTPGGLAVATFTIACNPRFRGSGGDWETGETVFLRCTAWRQTAENICESLQRGDPVIVNGRFRQQTWKDRSDNDRRTDEIQVDAIGVSLEYHTVRLRKSNRNGTGEKTASNPVSDSANDKVEATKTEPPF